MDFTQIFKVRADHVESFCLTEDWETGQSLWLRTSQELTMMTAVNPQDFIECLLGAWQSYEYLVFVLLNLCSTPAKNLLPSLCVH